MKMVFRWFGEGNDTVQLGQIKQIPGVEGIVWALHDVPVGEEWPMDKILAYKRQADEYGLHLEVVESVNVHEDIKLGLPSRDRYIDNYMKTIGKLARVGVKTICYNFMPVFDWIRTDLFKELEDGSTALFYEKAKAHIRNVRVYENGDFIETSHRTTDGTVNICEVVRAFHDCGFTGYARPDHGRHIWDERCRPGYGLYDRALEIMYLWGVWDSLERAKRGYVCDTYP